MAVTTEFAHPEERANDVPDTADDTALMRKVALRLIPFLFFLYVIAYLDRVNVGFAKLQMGQQLGIGEKEYGFAAGVFFIGYFLFEVPSNLLLQRFGARKWIMRIMISWGLVAMGMLFVKSVPMFYGMRFLLGLAEAGFYPGILLYLTFWFTAKDRAKMVAWFMTANAVSFIVGGPLSGWLMTQTIFLGLAGWQQMFLLEGLPAILMGFVVLAYLPDGPRSARWLNEDEKVRIQARLSREAPPVSDKGDHASLMQVLKGPLVWVLCGCYFCFVAGMYGFSLWIPQIVKQLGNLTLVQAGLLTAVPFLISGSFMVASAYHSDYTGERALHICYPGLVGAAGLVAYGFLKDPALALIALSIAASGMWAMLGPFWAMVKGALGKQGPVAIAAGLAFINAVGNLGGFLGPYVVGLVKDLTKNFAMSVLTLAGFVVVGSVLAVIAGRLSGSSPGASAPKNYE
jgi:sugar phosphate permease